MTGKVNLFSSGKNLIFILPSSNQMNSTLFSNPNPAPAAAAVSPTHPSLLFPQITRCRTIRELTQVHAHFIKTGLIRDQLASAEILKFLSTRHRDLAYARKLFAGILQPNCFSWNTIIRAFAETELDFDEGNGNDDNAGSNVVNNNNHHPLEALLYFCQMCNDGSVQPNRFTFPSVLKACAILARIEEGKQVHGYVVKLGLDSDEFIASNLVRMYVRRSATKDANLLFKKHAFDNGDGGMFVRDKRRQEGTVVLWNVMIDGYVRLGDLGACRELFDGMPQRSVVSWNVMISGYAQHGHFKEAIKMFRDMQLGEVSPNYVTLVSVLPAISRLGALELGKWVHLYAEQSGIEIDDVLGSALIDMYSKCGSIEKAVQVFKSIPNNKNPVNWNALIGGLAMHGKAMDAVDYFWRMQEAGVTPTDVLYICLLSACSHAGLVEEGRSVFNHMVNVVGLEPRIEHYGCMVDMFGRAGLLEEAEQVIINMPVKPDDVIWKALLCACKMHGNIEIGKRAAKILMDSFPDDGGSYAALSNLFAAMGNWRGVAELRLKMTEMSIRKDNGCSWIELDGVIHEFLVEDDSHPRAKEIHSMLEEISYKLRLAGCQPNTKQVDAEEKQTALHYHSEKIAIAFGLISTSPDTTLRIVKNSRVCEDCHSSIKLISKLYNRKIIVRDRKRFHHFDSGLCSCNDYC